eukprot:TRINITY_DN3888_c0_g1_i2.p1 TRINITY_DN3888_c0_g1~~TRINITY_DN3888_c0_g1_i2.p1  ORF type:complete len:316 (-),score=66.45 TRINITY_DN3888_c0_g1_i2:89-1036(-)
MVLSLTLFLSLSSHQILSSPASTRAEECIIISGGDGGDGLHTSVQVFNPSTGLSCSLPSLPEGRIYHTQDGLMVCGGGPSDKRQNCVTFTSGEWVLSHTLVNQRMVHNGWMTDQGLLLLGGGNHPFSTEIVTAGVEQGVESFAMKYDTRNACSMPDLKSDSIIVTGGYQTKQQVSRYDINGFVEDLPDLIVRRAYHSCGSYLRADGSQVLLVAGGSMMDWMNTYLDSTEVLTEGSSAWTLSSPLPRALSGLKGLNLGGRVYMTGGSDQENNKRDEVFVWLDEEQVWEEAGNLKTAHSIHAVSTIQMDDPAMEYCS